MTFAEVASSAKRCRFPLGADDWCGARTVPGCSWCPDHRARVFIPRENVPSLHLGATIVGQHRRDRELGGDPQPGWRRGAEIAA